MRARVAKHYPTHPFRTVSKREFGKTPKGSENSFVGPLSRVFCFLPVTLSVDFAVFEYCLAFYQTPSKREFCKQGFAYLPTVVGVRCGRPQPPTSGGHHAPTTLPVRPL